MKRLASGKLGKHKCIPKTMVSKKEEMKEEEVVPDYEFNLPALGFRIKKGRKGSKKSRKGSKKSRKGSKKSRKGSKKSRKASKKSRKASKKAKKGSKRH